MRSSVFASLLGLLCLLTGIQSAMAFEIEYQERFGTSNAASVIRILSSTDSDRFKPVINGFIKRNPDLGVHYVTASTANIYAAIASEKQPFDLVISSAMDLQMKLANDGFTKAVNSTQTSLVPSWARWRTEVFGFALEPVVMLISKKDFANLPVPRTRREMLALIRNNASIFKDRIGTYNPETSGAGYLFSTQDARQSDTFWRLAEVMGRLNAKLYCCTSKMIEAVEKGDLALAYNLLGSYANATLPADSNAQIVAFEDYTHILLRTAIIPITSKNPVGGIRFLDFLVSPDGQSILDTEAKLPALNNSVIDKLANRKPIRLDSGLLVFLDRMKKAHFLREWSAALIQN
ncbi:ABC transporter substrate-binding protein [Candidatus Puniceispirillum marinum]|uniref:Extracellular solute-binding protein, family 1 n=1 Tax=Puniceispirillum marinum (strain IMCC1322) TaxID=488538 RepID=D5BND1_PUNMI|nr:ABC transporter substrate-binding protein [Candidatus Puniceispirillum marinum]ADE40324.1 extracellular solute-binding protein, family 1 [Candidatus Puniceispirillum marinum IMCC1322]